jgi:plastocyanin
MRPKLLIPPLAILGLASLGLATLQTTTLLPGPGSTPARAEGDPHHAHSGVPLTDADMRRWVDDWFARHPEVGRGASAAAVADTFFVLGSPNVFDSDGNTATVVDTAKILVGEAVLWRWVSGSHTITSGTGSGDPLVGQMFDVSSTSTNPTFEFTYNSEGTFHFFCRPHESLNMRGVVVVSSAVGVGPPEGPAIGFTAGPSPNPSRSGIGFRFSLREAGPVRAEVVDVGGRRVATVLDQRFVTGAYQAAWSGLDARGGRASAGVYYLRLELPGHSSTRRFVIAP